MSFIGIDFLFRNWKSLFLPFFFLFVVVLGVIRTSCHMNISLPLLTPSCSTSQKASCWCISEILTPRATVWRCCCRSMISTPDSAYGKTSMLTRQECSNQMVKPESGIREKCYIYLRLSHIVLSIPLPKNYRWEDFKLSVSYFSIANHIKFRKTASLRSNLNSVT